MLSGKQECRQLTDVIYPVNIRGNSLNPATGTFFYPEISIVFRESIVAGHPDIQRLRMQA